MSFKRRGFRFLLAALLLFGQQQAGLHLLGHGFAELSAPGAGLDPRRESNDPQELVCAKCLAIADLDHAVSGVAQALLPVASSLIPADASVVPLPDLAFFASYRSRAPPAFS